MAVKGQGYKVVSHIDHYLDDYITMGAPATSECQRNLSIILDKCEILGVPIGSEKLVGPSTCLTFLGIEINTEEGVMRLPTEKLARIQSQIRDWSQHRVCRKQQLESLIGLLQHACRVVRPGRSFFWRMISLLNHSHHPYHHIRLTKHFRADFCWWQTFLPAWNGVFVLPPQPDLSVCFVSDASGQWGCGARWHTMWFQFRWLHCLFFIEACCQFELVARYIPGVHNVLADDLSRNRFASFLSKVPQASQEPIPIPPQLPQYYWIQGSIGHHPVGHSGSILLCERTRRLYPEDIPSSTQPLLPVLYNVQC